MADSSIAAQNLEQAYADLKAAQDRVLAAKRALPALTVSDYTLHTPTGAPVGLLSLFGDRSELMVIHNMGRGCRYCTLWADGFNGIVAHLEDRVPFVVVTPDEPEIVKEFSESRGWRFKILSAHGTSFFNDMGFEKNGRPQPGISTFLKQADGTVLRTASDSFGPGDDYCAIWHLFDLLPKGVNDWEPEFKY
jgi:predicted dithiol-disulfide oxidoreductase (DUF899 family)